jgi:dUTP pyrophosphatase
MKMDKVIIKIKRLNGNEDLPFPKYMTEHSAGADLFAAVNEDVEIAPEKFSVIPTGISILIPEGFEAQIRPRSGLAANYGVTLLNSPGTIDADYRGEIKLIVINHGVDPFIIKRGDRIGQMIITPVVKAEFVEVEELAVSIRNEGGFGHTG